ncbi:MAG: hypothetical protein KF824_06860 [Fimbriimonadaceae bacterium]|nr:MAG: hypothetical protein KF824_06860 [Fimbriimonadaceae bacterium]
MLNLRKVYSEDLGAGISQEADIVKRLFAGRLVDECPTYILSLDPELILHFDYDSLRVGSSEIKIYCLPGTALREKLEWYILESKYFTSDEMNELVELLLGIDR